jgi:hypothetical protein
MNQNEILKQIARAGEYFDALGQVPETAIVQIEKELDVTLPESYKWYVRNYGQGGIGGVEIFGVGLNNVLPCVEITNDYRRVGLPKQYVVIQNVDEWIYCLDTETMTNGECPVVDWDRQAGTGRHKYDNFFLFLYEKFEQELGSLAEDGLIE